MTRARSARKEAPEAAPLEATVERLLAALRARAAPHVAASTRRYFPDDIHALGVTNAGVRVLADDFVAEHHLLGPEVRLALAEAVLARSYHHEEVLLGFALLRKLVRRSYDEALLARFRFWLERYVRNWAQCDDLCLTVLYPFFLSRVESLGRIQDWTESSSPWCRRAANVALVKFVSRKIGSTPYRLPLDHILGNARRLLEDPEPYVQKSVGWLLKVAADHHRPAVVEFIESHIQTIHRDTLRYAIERLDEKQRKSLMTLEH
ncbi:DNA alkylation repair protein [Myxococcus sp. K15C18031901]|uniref:DNA alkylation repair protein n=1 Tax=Myxococcus dinghuensis TaxID=2906761 RepID=UPI0020A7A1EB|nr:DNA alkylation repair protein [Myxococcus dinghuensis]MCP3098086.1 DNA alkylation repair protein [Myxococcus dinghuensis]